MSQVFAKRGIMLGEWSTRLHKGFRHPIALEALQALARRVVAARRALGGSLVARALHALSGWGGAPLGIAIEPAGISPIGYRCSGVDCQPSPSAGRLTPASPLPDGTASTASSACSTIWQ